MDEELQRLMELYGDGPHGERLIFASYFRKLSRKEIPETFPPELGEDSPFADYYRRAFISLMGYAQVSYDWVRPLAEFIGNRRVLEVMSGAGALARALQSLGVSLIPTDDYSWRPTFGSNWTKVHKKSALPAIGKYGKDVDFVLISWPYVDNTAERALLKMRQVNSRCRMIYIGEPAGGCTAGEGFFSQAVKDEEDSALEPVRAAYHRWKDYNDSVWLLR